MCTLASVAVLVGLVMLAGGAAVLLVGWLAAGDRLPRNGWAGIRTLTTLRDDETWYAAHRAGARWLLLSGAAAAIVGTALLAVRPGDGAAGMLATVGGLVCGGCAIVAGIVGHRAARAVVRARSEP